MGRMGVEQGGTGMARGAGWGWSGIREGWRRAWNGDGGKVYGHGVGDGLRRDGDGGLGGEGRLKKNFFQGEGEAVVLGMAKEVEEITTKRRKRRSTDRTERLNI